MLEKSFATAIGLSAAMTGFGLIAMICLLAVIDEVVEDMVTEPTWQKKVKAKPKKQPTRG